MRERVVSLSDRGRGLEWLSLGFGLLLVADLVVALLLGEAKPSSAHELAGMIEPARALVLAAGAGQLIAIAALAVGLVTLFRCGHRLWFGCALAALTILLVTAVAAVSLPWFDLRDRTSDWNMIYGSGAGAEVCLAAFVLLGIRALAGDDEDTVPVFVLGAAIGAAVFRWALVGTFPFDEEMRQYSPMLPAIHAGLVALWIAVPIAVAGVAFAALLPCALLARELATRLRQRFAEPPRAIARTS